MKNARRIIFGLLGAIVLAAFSGCHMPPPHDHGGKKPAPQAHGHAKPAPAPHGGPDGHGRH